MGATPGRQDRLNLSGEAAAATARAYAQFLLASLGATPARPFDLTDEHPALSWTRSGLMALTGLHDGAPQMCPVPLAACADGALAALGALAPPGAFENLRGARLLAGRAAIAGYARAGSTSPGGSCRLMDARDGVIALNLARDDDWALLPAWLECAVPMNWDAVARLVRRRPTAELVERGRELGLAAAAFTPSPLAGEGWGEGWFQEDVPPPPAPSREGRGEKKTDLLRGAGGNKLLVVDLSSLWAGPLCSHLLQACGAEVIKVESTARPDGARQGPPAFFDRLNAGKRSVVLDFSTHTGREQLRALLHRADIVIEGSRPRALRQLGIQAEAILEDNPGLTWISLTGYGRDEGHENWIAYGDDAAVAAGLSYIQYQATGQRMFVGDAIADPLTGLHAALAAWVSWRNGGGRLIALALRDVVRHCIEFDLPPTPEAIRERQQAWSELGGDDVSMPRVL